VSSTGHLTFRGSEQFDKFCCREARLLEDIAERAPLQVSPMEGHDDKA
jgi:hypothetical protein